MARPAKHDERTREAVLDAAEELLADGGLEAVTVRAVADRVGESTRAVYSQFASMADVIGALGARGFQLVADVVNALPATDDPLHDLVEVGVSGFREFAVTRPQLFRITFHQISSEITRQPEAAPALHASYESLATRFQRAIDTDRLPKRPLIEYTFAFHSFTSGLAANELSMQPPPIGASFWGPARDVDMVGLWRTALGAFIMGLANGAVPPPRRAPGRRPGSASPKR